MTTGVLHRETAAVAASTPSRLRAEGTRSVATSAGRVTLSLFRRAEDARERWLALEQRVACSCSQSYRWTEAWQRNVADPKGIETAVVIGGIEGKGDVFVFPFEVVAAAGMRMLRWLGVAQTNYNFPPIDPSAGASFGAADISALLAAAADQIGGISGAILINQPFRWAGVDNPFARLPHQSSPSAGYAIALTRDFSKLLEERLGPRTRSSLRRKEKRIRDLGQLSFEFCGTTAASNRVLQTYFDQKAARFVEVGIGNIFADPDHRAFYRDMAAGGEAEGRLEMGALKIGAQTAATLGAIRYQDRANMLLLSIGDGEVTRWSPGVLLINEAIRRACSEGIGVYDFGVGGGSHKDMWCDGAIELFDSFVAFRAAGHIVTAPLAAKARLKRLIKSNPTLWSLAVSMRRLIKGRAPDASD